MSIGRHYAWSMALDFIIGKLYTNSLLASLNTRQHNRSQVSGAVTDLHIRAIRFANPPQLPQIAEIFKNGERLSDVYEVALSTSLPFQHVLRWQNYEQRERCDSSFILHSPFKYSPFVFSFLSFFIHLEDKTLYSRYDVSATRKILLFPPEW